MRQAGVLALLSCLSAGGDIQERVLGAVGTLVVIRWPYVVVLVIIDRLLNTALLVLLARLVDVDVGGDLRILIIQYVEVQFALLILRQILYRLLTSLHLLLFYGVIHNLLLLKGRLAHLVVVLTATHLHLILQSAMLLNFHWLALLRMNLVWRQVIQRFLFFRRVTVVRAVVILCYFNVLHSRLIFLISRL